MDSAKSGKKMETGISAGPRALKWLGAITPLSRNVKRKEKKDLPSGPLTGAAARE